MKGAVLQFLFHNKDPVYSVDFHPTIPNRFATCGGDSAVRLWRIVLKGTEIFPIEPSPTTDTEPRIKNKKHPQVIDFFSSSLLKEDEVDLTIEYISTLESHNAAVNVVRHSPDGNTIASAGDDGAILLWKKREELLDGSQRSSGNIENNLLGNDEFSLEKWKVMNVLRGSLSDIYDLAWSPSGQFIITGSVDNTARIWDVTLGGGKCVKILDQHNYYVQGVAWDPLSEFVVTQSSDRTVKFHGISPKQSSDAFVTHCLGTFYRRQTEGLKVESSHMDEESSSTSGYMNLYQSENLASFFRRPAFTPDGALILTPAGLHKDPISSVESFAVHIYQRNRISQEFGGPSIRLAGFPKPPVVIKCSPILYELNSKTLTPPLLSLNYRSIFAVATQDSVFIYDTQHRHPIAFVTNLHYSSLTDVTWSCDGKQLLVSAVDGFVSILKLEDDELTPQHHVDITANIQKSATLDHSASMKKKANVYEMIIGSATPSTCNEITKSPSKPTNKKRRVAPTLLTPGNPS